MSNKRQDIYRGHKEKGMWWLDEDEIQQELEDMDNDDWRTI